MTEQVTKLRVFVASPGDVQKERELLDDVIDELNRGIADDKGLILELVRWETHAWPAMGEDAQDVINRQIAPGDVLVGIMWNRFGTPTKRAESGTKEEFDRAYAYWREYGRPKIMFYFNCAPFSPSSVDELEQKRKVLAFKQELSDKGALYWEYNGVDEFERLVRGHLTKVIRVIWESRPEATPKKPIVPQRVFGQELTKELDRALGGGSAETIAEIEKLVREDRLEEALTELSNMEQYRDEATLLTRRLNRIRGEERLGTVTREYADTERTRIADAILQIVSS